VAVATDPVRAQRMAAAGRQRVVARFSMDVKLERTETLYRRLVAEARPPNLTRGPSPRSAKLEASGRSAAAARWGTAFFVSSAAFLALALIVSLPFASGGGAFGWERALMSSIALLALPEVREVFGWITVLGSRNHLLPLGVLVLMTLPTRLLRRWWLWALVIGAVVHLEALVKDLVGRFRPMGSRPGFPSGHTAWATAFFLMVAYLVGARWTSDQAKASLWSLAILIVATVGVSQSILGVAPLDVIGGALLGITCAAAAAAWNEGRPLPPGPFRSVTWMAFRKWVYRWQMVVLMLSLAVLFVTPPALEEDSLLDAMADWSGAWLIVVGILLRAWAAGYAAGQTWPESLATRRLTTRGPYGYVRNPVALANCLIGVGVIVLAENAPGLVVVPAVLIAISRLTISVEEEALLHRFGEVYAEYCRHVPRWIPRMRPAPSIAPPMGRSADRSGPVDRFAWDGLRSEWPATLNAILLAYVAETSEHLPHLFS
jgi:protein-S-isoprenylcysteine O-methyltransferase Ste14/membrane-associated phospholipid phosphatase